MESAGNKLEFIRGTAAVAKMLGVHERTVGRWVKARILPVTKVHGAMLYRVADLEAALGRLTIPSVLDKGQARGRGRKARATAAEGGRKTGAQ